MYLFHSLFNSSRNHRNAKTGSKKCDRLNIYIDIDKKYWHMIFRLNTKLVNALQDNKTQSPRIILSKGQKLFSCPGANDMQDVDGKKPTN